MPKHGVVELTEVEIVETARRLHRGQLSVALEVDIAAVALPIRKRRDEDVPELLVARELAAHE